MPADNTSIPDVSSTDAKQFAKLQSYEKPNADVKPGNDLLRRCKEKCQKHMLFSGIKKDLYKGMSRKTANKDSDEEDDDYDDEDDDEQEAFFATFRATDCNNILEVDLSLGYKEDDL